MPDPPYLQALKGEMPIMKMGWFKSYKASFIDANRFRPVVHIITGIMLLGYTLEYFHHLKGEPQPPSLALCNGTTGAPLPHPLFPFLRQTSVTRTCASTPSTRSTERFRCGGRGLGLASRAPRRYEREVRTFSETGYLLLARRVGCSSVRICA